MTPAVEPGVLAVDAIAGRILTLRGRRLIVDADLAALYGVTTKRLNEQVKRNATRFPADFMVRLTAAEKAEVVANCDHLRRLKFAKALPFAFTEYGAIMAASVLNSERAVEVSVYVVRAFVQLRDLLAGNRELERRLVELEQHIEQRLRTHDQAIGGILEAIRRLMTPPPPSSRPIGFVTPQERKR